MMLQTEEDSVLVAGLHSEFDQQSTTSSAERGVVENNFVFKPTGICRRAASVSLSCTHAALVEEDTNSVWSWGHGEGGALGLDEHLIANLSPPSPITVTSISCQVKQVACGADFTLILTTEGQVYSCGSGAFGKLGHGDEQDKRLPSLVGVPLAFLTAFFGRMNVLNSPTQVSLYCCRLMSEIYFFLCCLLAVFIHDFCSVCFLYPAQIISNTADNVRCYICLDLS